MKESSKHIGLPNISDKEHNRLWNKAFVQKERMTKYEIRALYQLTQKMFAAWMQSIFKVDERIPLWKTRRSFKPSECEIIFKDFGEVGQKSNQ